LTLKGAERRGILAYPPARRKGRGVGYDNTYAPPTMDL